MNTLSLLSLFVLSLLFCVATSQKTVLTFSRSLDSCDAAGDYPIDPTGTTRVVYAFNDNKPDANNPPQYHQSKNRGAKSVNLLDNPNPQPSETDLQTIDVRVNQLQVPSLTTYYHCQAFKLPTDRKRHIVKFEPVIQAENIGVVHHILVYQCPILNATDFAYQGPCYDPNRTPYNMQVCNGLQPISAWAVGGGDFVYPAVTGYPMGSQDGAIYVLMEVHYNNPNALSTIVDSSGMRYTYTEQLRQYDSAMLSTGHVVYGATMQIPPKQEAYPIDSFCHPSCTVNIPDSGINVIGSFLHSHLAGRQIIVRHSRNGTELPILDRNLHYDFDFQDVVTFNPPKIINRGDALHVRCVYNTMDRTNITYAGLSTQDEMCLAYFIYYPKAANVSRCLSEEVAGMGNVSVCPQLPDGYGVVTPPQITTPLPPAPACKVPPWGNKSTLATQPLSSFDPSVYAYHTYLDAANKYMLYWNYNTSVAGLEHIDFAVAVETSGWVGFGISPNGGMVGADIMMGWVNANGSVTVYDRMATAMSLPGIDVSQDLFNVAGMMWNDRSNGGSNGISGGAIAGIVIAVVVVFVIAGFVIYRRKQATLRSEDAPLLSSSGY